MGRGIRLLPQSLDVRAYPHLVSYTKKKEKIHSKRLFKIPSTFTTSVPVPVVVAVGISALLSGGNAIYQVVRALAPHFRQHRLQDGFIPVQIVGDKLSVNDFTEYE